MTTTNWRTNLGGAIGTTGTALVGVGVLAQLSQLSTRTAMLSETQLVAMWYVALVGFVLSCIGKGVTALFAADAKQLEATHQETQAQIEDIKSAVRTGDTSIISNPMK